MDQARASGEDAYDLLLADAPTGADAAYGAAPLRRQRHALAGHRVQGCGAGAHVSHGSVRTLAKAILEGLTFELRINLDLLRDAGIPIETLHAVGGGARSPLWLQLKADICRIPLRKPRVTEAACLGAALAAGVAAGVYSDFEAAVATAVGWQSRIEPEPASVAAYAPRFELYTQLYPLLADFQHHL